MSGWRSRSAPPVRARQPGPALVPALMAVRVLLIAPLLVLPVRGQVRGRVPIRLPRSCAR